MDDVDYVETRTEFCVRRLDGTLILDVRSATEAREMAARIPGAVPVRRLVYIGPTEEITGGSNE